MTTMSPCVRRAASVLAVCAAAMTAAASPASDNACNTAYDAGFGSNLGPLNGGTGFNAWEFATFTTSGPTFAGFFAAQPNQNVDLNNIRCTGGRAWGLFANSNQPSNALAIASATRPLTAGSIAVGQTVRVQFEHSGVRDGNFNPQNGPDIGGWVGFTLRSGGEGAPLDPIPFLNGVNGTFGFGFRGGGTEYQIHDTITPSGRNSGVGFTFDGLDVQFTRRPNNAYLLRIERLPSGPVTFATGQASNFGQIMISNRNAQQGDAFFNNISVTDGCAGDFNNDSVRNPNDIFAFLNAYFAQDIRADWDGNRLLQPADIFGFLNAYFAGCP
jgi:hypothetical protein